MSENRLFLSGEENKYSIAIASIVKYLEHSFFSILLVSLLRLQIYQCVQFNSVLLISV